MYAIVVIECTKLYEYCTLYSCKAVDCSQCIFCSSITIVTKWVTKFPLLMLFLVVVVCLYFFFLSTNRERKYVFLT